MSVSLDPLDEAAKWLRNKAKFPQKDYVFLPNGKRVVGFKGKDFLEVLLSDRFNDRKPKEDIKPLTCTNDHNANSLATKLLRSQVLLRLRPSKDARERDLYKSPAYQHDDQSTFDAKGTYCWVIEADQTRYYVMGTLGILFTIMLCCIKVWPIWMKIALWWLSMAYLVTFSAVVIARLAVYMLLFAIGFKGVWLLPNIFDDDAGIIGAFSPIIAQDKKYWKRTKVVEKPEPADEAKDSGSSAADKDSGLRNRGGKDAKEAEKRMTPEERAAAKKARETARPGWHFGLFNLGMLLLLGAGVGWHFGLFDPENIPAFLVSQEELWKQFPALAPPNFTHPVEFTRRADGEDGTDDTSTEQATDDASGEKEYEPRHQSASIEAELGDEDFDLDSRSDE